MIITVVIDMFMEAERMRNIASKAIEKNKVKERKDAMKSIRQSAKEGYYEVGCIIKFYETKTFLRSKGYCVDTGVHCSVTWYPKK